MSLLTPEGLRSELERFAQTTMKSQLAELATAIAQDSATILLEKMRNELESVIKSSLQDVNTDSVSQSRSELLAPMRTSRTRTSPAMMHQERRSRPSRPSSRTPSSRTPSSHRPSREPEEMIVAKEKAANMRKAIATSPAVAQELQDLGYLEKLKASKKDLKQEEKNSGHLSPVLPKGVTTTTLFGSEKQNIMPHGDMSYFEVGGSSALAVVVRSQAFEHCVLAVICANAVFLGIEVNALAKDAAASDALGFRVSGIIFTVIFTAELILKIIVFRRWFFKFTTPLGCRNRQWSWNMLDTIFVGTQLVECILHQVMDVEDSVLGKITVLRLLRILRVGRLFRVGKLLRYFRSLRTIVVSISQSWQLFFWTCVSLQILTYVFSIYITEVVSADLHAEEVNPNLKEHFGSVQSSMLSFAKAATAGIDWGDLYTPLREVSTVAAYPFAGFTMFLLIVVMNVFAGMFLNNVSQRAEQENELDLLNQAYVVFKATDEDETGNITKEDFQEHVSHPDVRGFFEAIDLDIQQAEVLFDLLDMTKDGWISRDEFLRGCLRLRGPTKALDLLILSREVTQLFDGLATFFADYADADRQRQKMLLEIVSENGRLLTLLCNRSAGISAEDLQ